MSTLGAYLINSAQPAAVDIGCRATRLPVFCAASRVESLTAPVTITFARFRCQQAGDGKPILVEPVTSAVCFRVGVRRLVGLVLRTVVQFYPVESNDASVRFSSSGLKERDTKPMSTRGSIAGVSFAVQTGAVTFLPLGRSELFFFQRCQVRRRFCEDDFLMILIWRGAISPIPRTAAISIAGVAHVRRIPLTVNAAQFLHLGRRGIGESSGRVLSEDPV